MDGIDATDRHFEVSTAPSPSLLTIILDTNPAGWADLQPDFPLSKAVVHLQIFINAHLALNHANQVALIASHTDRAEWLYPVSHTLEGRNGSHINGDEEASNGDTNSSDVNLGEAGMDANKYGPFFTVEQQIRKSLQALANAKIPSAVEIDAPTQLAGALTTALTYIHKNAQMSAPNADTGGGEASLAGVTQADGTTTTAGGPVLVSRVLVVSVSGDLSAQYISVMNAIFAAQRRQIPIDVLKLAGDTGFLQQACDATGGIYLEPEKDVLRGTGILQTLMLAYLTDVPARKLIISPGQGGVDFRAACFCHQKVIDLGFVCSVCLSIFCEPPPELTCLTCGTLLEVPLNFNVKPAVIPRRKKKKKRPGDSGAGTASEG